ncbi:hypothetical protein MTAT_04800 [Moorella thermoacetica]|uniref:TNase-like domain-containing protein n=1 Tax=Neomoorella thermoacetica TaxID=1525 RepID=A0AAC9MVJ6_NEOTH|nr:hypothetical protein [Moorella thermoacetica]AOQ24721.1 hypothetical protein Maut_02293 [Moorella thermoacetica]TYL15741.1 hypothetical protein MTAT_04800 [Moorella thermoacetica]
MRTAVLVIDSVQKNGNGWYFTLDGQTYYIDSQATSQYLKAYLEKFAEALQAFKGLELSVQFDGNKVVQASLPLASLAILNRLDPDVMAGKSSFDVPFNVDQAVVAGPSFYESPPPLEEDELHRVVKGRVVWRADDDAYNRNDGDTFYVEGLGLVRLWGVNAPEIPHWENGEFVGQEEPGGYAARDYLRDLVANKDIVLVIDKTIDKYGRPQGQDAFGRWLVVAYARDASGKWININKAMLATGHAALAIRPDEYGRLPGYFQRLELEKYVRPRNKSAAYLRNIGLVEGEDDRDKVLGAFDPDKSLRIGDVQFEVPPERIKVTRRQSTQKVPLMRAKSSIYSGCDHEEVMVEVDLYFHDLESINGTQKIIQLPSGKEMLCYVNGLRSLIAQFRRAPFLPVTNTYLNEIEGIQAVTLAELQVNTVPGFPKVLQAHLTMYAFDYTLFLPTVLDFDSVFNWPVFRYYYQQCLTYRAPEKLYLEPLQDVYDTIINFSIINGDELEKRRQARLYLAKHKPVTPQGFIQSIEKTGQKNGNNINERALNDLYHLEEAQDEYYERVKPLWDKYNQTHDERDNPWYQYAHGSLVWQYYRYDPNTGDEWLEIPVSNGQTVATLMARYWDRMTSFVPVSVVTDDEYQVAMQAYRIRLPEMHGTHEQADVEIPEIIRRNAFPNDGLAQQWAEEREAYKEAERVYYGTQEYDMAMDPWPIYNLNLVSASVALQNILVPLQAQVSSSPAYQYLGSNDVIINLVFETSDATAVQALTALIERATYYAREYRQDITSGFLGIDHPLTSLFGVKYVIPIQAASQTVAPGVYRVELMLAAYDRYQRRQATAQKFAQTNYYTRRDPNYQTQRQLDYQAVVEKLRDVEIYPDLELPTYAELNEAGFVGDISNRAKYPDPDFYITADIQSIGDMVNEAFSYGPDGRMQDAYGGVIQITGPRVSGGKVVANSDLKYNDIAQEMVDKSNELAAEYGPKDEEIAVNLTSRFSGGDLFTEPKFYDGNLPKEEIQGMLVQLAQYYSIPPYVVLGLIDTENSLYLQFYSTDPQVNRSWLGDVGAVPRSNIPVMTFPDGHHSTNDSLENIKRATGVGIMQINCRNYADNSDEVKRIAYDIGHNLELGIKILVGKYQQVVNGGMYLPSEIDGINPQAEDARWLAACLLYKGYAPKYWGGSGAQRELRRLKPAFDRYRSFASTTTISLDTLLSPPSTPQPEPIEPDGNRLQPGQFDDLFYRSTEDMRLYDRRGRLVRAFPTFLLILLDEGRVINTYKLHDNFYSYHAVTSIEVHRSRKIAADTAVIEISNVFRGFDTTPDVDYESGDFLADAVRAFRSLLQAPIRDLEAQRSLPYDVLKIKTGARVHLRIGYGSDAASLPIMLNGTVTELSVGEVVKMIVQGDGIELTNKLPLPPDNHTGTTGLVDKVKSALGFPTEPRDILFSLLTWRGGYIQSLIHNFMPAFFDGNPLGIAHFGEMGKDALFFWNNPEDCGAEIMQNIYSATSEPQKEDTKLGFLGAWLFGKPDEPSFEIQLFNKTLWDLLQILAAATPDFIATVHPFQFRSTIFFGKPHWDFIYDYAAMENVDGKIKVTPKLKPYRQLHFYTSATDILSNQIEASERYVKTCVIGLYNANINGADQQQTTPPIWLDTDIFPEKQKTTIVDTSIYVGGVKLFNNVPVLNLIPFTINWIDRLIGGGPKIAMRVATSALRDYVRDMYQGELVVAGDPSVKPYDSFYILDTYEEISGLAEVKAVTHHFSFDTGFITGISPDACTAIQDADLPRFWSLANNIAAYLGLKIMTATVARALRYGGTTNALNVLAKLAGGRGRTQLEQLAQAKWFQKALGAANQSEALKIASEYIQKIGAGAGKFGSAVLDDLSKLAGNKLVGRLAGIGRLASRTPAAAAGLLAGLGISLPALAATMVEFAVVMIISETVGNAIGNFLANRQAIKLAVLRKNGKEFSAGINGHNGCVYGDAGDLLTRLIKDNKFVQLFLKYGLSVDEVDNLAFQPFDERMDTAGYYEKVKETLQSLADANVLARKNVMSSLQSLLSKIVPAPTGVATGDVAVIRKKYCVLPQDLHSQPKAGGPMVKISDTGNIKIAWNIVSYPYARAEAWQAIQAVGAAVQQELGDTLVITSTYRQANPGGSSHMTGYAIDIDVPSRYESSSGRTTSENAQRWLVCVIEKLVEYGFIEILTDYKDVIQIVKEKYPMADVRFDANMGHWNHIHCMLKPPDFS